MADYVILSGGYYDFGFQLGRRTAENVNTILEAFKSTEFFAELSGFLDTEDGCDLLHSLETTVQRYCPDYVKELQGLATGAGVKYDELFLFNCDSEFSAALEQVPGGSHGVKYSSLSDGCTNISMTTTDGKVLLAHTEDIGPVAKDLGLMLAAEITDEKGDLVEQWTDYYVPGVLSGSKFTFNRHGVMLAANSIIQKGINRKGIPRKFMCRSLLTVRDSMEAFTRLQQAPGIATAYCFHYLQKTERGIDNTVIEVVGTPDGSLVELYQPTAYYHHCNILQHIEYPCHPEESSVHRTAVLSQYVNRGETGTMEHLLQAISDQRDLKFPVHRTGRYPDYLATGATGIFDVTAGTLSVYTDIPVKYKQTHTFNLNTND